MGKLIVFEGIDGSGKSTQFRMLCEKLDNEKREYKRIVFPQYSEPSSALIRMYLGGEFGSDPEDVNAYAASAFYAVDRYASFKKIWKEHYENGGLILSDRYTTSNAIHQASKVPDGEKEDFFRWLYEFEFGLLKLPKPDAVIYMDVPLSVCREQMRKREQATNTTADIHEKDEDYLAKCARCGALASEHYGWKRIECAPGGIMRDRADINDEIFAYLAKEVL